MRCLEIKIKLVKLGGEMIALCLLQLTIVRLILFVHKVDELGLNCVNNVSARLLEFLLVNPVVTVSFVIVSRIDNFQCSKFSSELALVACRLHIWVLSSPTSAMLLRVVAKFTRLEKNNLLDSFLRIFVSSHLVHEVSYHTLVVANFWMRQENVEEVLELRLTLLEELVGRVSKVLLARELRKTLWVLHLTLDG